MAKGQTNRAAMGASAQRSGGDVRRIAQAIEALRATRGPTGEAAAQRGLGSSAVGRTVKAGGDEMMRAGVKGVAGHLSAAVQRLEALRAQRTRKVKDVSISGDVAMITRDAERTRKNAGAFVDAWREVIPPALEMRTRVVGMRGGVATIEVESSAVLYELGRALRGGGEAAVRKRYGGTLARVVVKLARD